MCFDDNGCLGKGVVGTSQVCRTGDGGEDMPDRSCVRKAGTAFGSYIPDMPGELLPGFIRQAVGLFLQFLR